MKNSIKLSALIALAAVLFAFSPAVKKVYTVSPESTLAWLAKKVTGQHNGLIKIKEGTLAFDGTTLTGGSFVIDMTTIENLDIENPEYQAKLINHLNSPDFFNVAEYPTSTLKITKATNKGSDYEITGDLTIKGITNSVTFPATVSMAGNTVNANAKVTIDRSEWDVRYGSGSFFDGLGDKMIYDDIDFTIDLVAKAK